MVEPKSRQGVYGVRTPLDGTIPGTMSGIEEEIGRRLELGLADDAEDALASIEDGEDVELDDFDGEGEGKSSASVPGSRRDEGGVHEGAQKPVPSTSEARPHIPRSMCVGRARRSRRYTRRE